MGNQESLVMKTFPSLTPSLASLPTSSISFTRGFYMITYCNVSQWTSTEHKEMQRVFVGLLSGTIDDHVLVVIHSLLDFIYFAQCQQHTDLSLKAMEESLKTFHVHKYILIDLQVHKDFNGPKIHSLKHYMALWLQQQEAIHCKSVYLAWRQLRTLLGTDSMDGIPTNVSKSNSASYLGEILGNSCD
ncbi:hypothetical protein EDC04DRAFT_2604843 [Pisolithus marmoratus]|nr:hypothetical protein EDC04DRAFT_2604843 [Pisolithus marmoratus]